MGVAGHAELAPQRGLIELLAGLEMEGVAGQEGRWTQPVQRRAGRDQHHIGAVMLVMLADAPQRCQALADQVLVRRKMVVGQGFPVRKQHAAQRWIKKRQFVQQALRIGRVRGDDGHAAAFGLVARGESGQQGGIGRRQRARHGVALARSELGEFHERCSTNKTTHRPGQGDGESCHFKRAAGQPHDVLRKAQCRTWTPLACMP